MEAGISIVLENKQLPPDEVRFLNEVKSALARPEAVTVNLGDHRQIKMICLESPDQKFKIAVNTIKHWTDEGEGSKKPEYIQVSWLDESTGRAEGSQIRYDIFPDKTRTVIRPIRQVENWLVGDFVNNDVFGLGESKSPDKKDLEKVTEVMQNGKHYPQLQSEALYWLEEWYGFE